MIHAFQVVTREPKWGAHMGVKPKKLLGLGFEIILVIQKHKKGWSFKFGLIVC